LVTPRPKITDADRSLFSGYGGSRLGSNARRSPLRRPRPPRSPGTTEHSLVTLLTMATLSFADAKAHLFPVGRQGQQSARARLRDRPRQAVRRPGGDPRPRGAGGDDREPARRRHHMAIARLGRRTGPVGRLRSGRTWTSPGPGAAVRARDRTRDALRPTAPYDFHHWTATRRRHRAGTQPGPPGHHLSSRLPGTVQDR
jgi:hypothetical protein